MPRGESTSSGKKNKLGLTLPEVPKDPNEQNHTENGQEKYMKNKRFIYFLNLVFRMYVLNVYKKNLNNSIVPINKKIEWKNFLIQNVLWEN